MIEEITITPQLLRRFWSKVVQTDNCWIWIASVNKLGYGTFNYNHKTILAHRFAWQLVNSYIPEGMELDHLCRNPPCVRPDHLEPVTHKENCGRGNAGLYQSIKTHCPQGHEYSLQNTRILSNGGRSCKTCQAEYQQKWNKNHREHVNKRARDYRARSKFNLTIYALAQCKKQYAPLFQNNNLINMEVGLLQHKEKQLLEIARSKLLS